IKFSIKKPSFFNSTKNLMYVGLVSITFVVICFITIIILIKAKNKKRLASEKQLKNQAKIKLDSIRSQLNPHFMFNALAGIQNLMNKNKTEEANSYLGKFARLTRNVLDQKEIISLAEERDLLTDYLQMEQLRFGFNYEIIIDEMLDINNIEIPPMLLQPLVENAVKHGIAEKGKEGKVEVLFQKNMQDLLLKVIDNGNGFESDKNYQGLGLQLTKNRITLLNDIYSSTPIVLRIESNSSGTIITLTLSQWL
ncbi:MAG: sensor histidine kinase, partial [Pedobacter sp.]